MRDDLASIPKLGFGCMRLPLTDPADVTSVDIPQLTQMVDEFLAAGNTYFDTAFSYHDGASETALQQALTSRYPRDAYTVATKCPAAMLPNRESAQACLATSLERLGLTYIDFYLLHNLGGPRTAAFDDYGMWDYVLRKKEEGLIRNVGFSLHDNADALDALLTAHPQMDFVQLQVNYLDWDDPHNDARRLMEVAAAHETPVVIMEPARGGTLCRLPDATVAPLRALRPDASLAEWAYRFCWNLPNVVTMLSGMSTLDQVRENTASYRARVPLADEERAALGRTVEAMRSLALVPCTGCEYCVKGCPANVAIPRIMQLLNLGAMLGDDAFAKTQYAWQTEGRRASSCIGCGACEAACPQAIPIIDTLAVAAGKFE